MQVTNPMRTRDLEIRNVDKEILVHDPLHGKVHVLNRTAGRVLEMCDGTHSAAEIARSLSEASGADITIVARDIDAILETFAVLLLLET
jgi:hypothetical protein